MSFSIISHLVDKTKGTKGTDQVINYMNTNPLFMNKPTINRTVVPEPSIREYYNIKHSTNSVDPTAFALFTHGEYSSQNLQFKKYDRKTLMDDLKSGNPNYSNNFINYSPAYLNNNGQPLFRNNSVIGSVYNFENNTPKDIPFNYPGPSIAAGSDPYYEPPTGGAPGPAPSFPPPPTRPPPPRPPPTRPPPPQTEDTEENNKFSKNLTDKLKNLRLRKDFQSNVMRERIIKERIDEMRKEFFPQGSDKQLRKEVVKQINTTKRNIKNYEPTGNEHEPYTNKNIIERKKLIRLKQLGATLKSQNIVPRIRARLEGIRAVKALSSAQPPEETSKPAEPVISEDVEASSSKTVKPSKKKASSDKPVISDVQEASSSKTVKPSTKKDDTGAESDESDKTKVEAPDRMKEHKDLLETKYGIPKTITAEAAYSGSIEKIGLLNSIALEFYQKAHPSVDNEELKLEYANEFLTMITTGEKTSSGNKLSIKKPADLQKVLDQVRVMKKR